MSGSFLKSGFSVLQHVVLAFVMTYGRDGYAILLEISTAPRQEYSATVSRTEATASNPFPLILKPLPFLTRKIGIIDVRRAYTFTTVTYQPFRQDDIYPCKPFHSFDSALGYFGSKVHAPSIRSRITTHPEKLFTTQQSTTYQWNACDTVLIQKVELYVASDKPDSTQGRALYTTDVQGMARQETSEPFHINFWVLLDLLLHNRTNLEAVKKQSPVHVRSLLTHGGYPHVDPEEDWIINSIDTLSSATSIQINFQNDKANRSRGVVVQHRPPLESDALSLEDITSVDVYLGEKLYVRFKPITPAPVQQATPQSPQIQGSKQTEEGKLQDDEMDTS